jgi:hypothetical protein
MDIATRLLSFEHWPWPHKTVQEFSVPAHAIDGSDYLVEFDSRRFVTRMRAIQSTLKFSRSDAGIIWLSYGDLALHDWQLVGRHWTLFCATLAPLKMGVGFHGAALGLHESRHGYLAARFVVEIARAFLPQNRIWLGVSLEPARLCELYSRDEITGLSPIEHLKSQGCRIAADLPLTGAGLKILLSMEEVAGACPEEKLVNYSQLFDWASAFRVKGETSSFCIRRTLHTRTTRKPFRADMPLAKKNDHLRSRIKGSIPRDIYSLFSSLDLSDFVLTLVGVKKFMRTSGPAWQLDAIRSYCAGMGLHTRELTVNGWMRRDRGKGGWSSLYEEDGRKPVMEKMLFIGASNADLDWVMENHDDNDNVFGEMLGYPACCRAFYARTFRTALQHQGDHVPLVVEQTAGHAPWPVEMNIFARYFGQGLISYFPCSLRCPEAWEQASAVRAFLEKDNPVYAQSLVNKLLAPVLYTEYSGIHRFDDAHVSGSIIKYDPRKIESTNPRGRLTHTLNSESRLECVDGAIKIGGTSYRPTNLCLASFRDKCRESRSGDTLI